MSNRTTIAIVSLCVTVLLVLASAFLQIGSANERVNNNARTEQHLKGIDVTLSEIKSDVKTLVQMVRNGE